MNASFTPAPPFKVQAERLKKQHGTGWVTDAVELTLPSAIETATNLMVQFDRRVRVVDQEHRICWRPPAPTGAGICKMCRKRPAKVDDVVCQYCRRATRARKSTPAPIPELQRCVKCQIKYRQDGELCRGCARTDGEARGVKAIQTAETHERYPRGAFCPIRPFAPHVVKSRDDRGREVEMIVVWDGRA
jgi:hypothetical protein